MNKIPITTLLAYNAFNDANNLMAKYHMPVARTEQELSISLEKILKAFPDEAAKDFANIHPHKEFIVQWADLPRMTGNEAIQNEMNEARSLNLSKLPMKHMLDAKSKEVAETVSNATGSVKVQPKEWIPVVAVAGIFLFAIAIYVRMSKT